MSAKVEAVDYHRNGVGGVGFLVAIVRDTVEGRMLVVDFNYRYAYVKPEDCTEDYDDTYGYTAVLELDKAAEGNIFMYPEDGHPNSGGNAYRGDRLGDQYRPLINAAYDSQVAARDERWKRELEQRKQAAAK